jgi:hypothetical protein
MPKRTRQGEKMAILKVRKDGSETYTTILSAYMAAQSGDTIEIGQGTFVESLEILKQNITFTGAGKDQTIIQGNYVAGAASQAAGCSWTSGNDFFTYTTPSTGGVFVPFAVGMSIGDTSASLATPGGFPAGSQVASIDVANKKVYINKTFTATQTAKTVRHYGVQATFEVRVSGFSMSNLKVIDMSGSVVSGSIEYSAIFLGSRTVTPALSKYSSSHASGFNINNCEIVADGDSAILSEGNVGVGNGTVDSCIISGKTFTGQYSPGTGNAVKNAVFFHPSNLPITFTNNKLDVICGGMTNAATPVYGGNQIATIDSYGSVVSGNSFKGKAVDPSGAYFNMTGLALRMRGGAATVSSNVIRGFNGLVTGGYLILPSYTNLPGKTIPVGEVITVSNRYFKCTVEHLYATDKHPVTGGALAAAHWNELTGDIAALLIANGKANYQANSGTNITVTVGLVSASQPSAGQSVATNLDKAQLKLVPKVSGSVAFADDTSWELVSCIFKKAGSSQRIVMSFRDFSAQKLGKLKAGMAGGDNFQLHKIIIAKSDRSLLVLNRSDIDEVSDNDFALKS